MFWNFIIFVAVLITFSESRSFGATKKSAEILKYESKIDELGRYKYHYETSNNIRRQEEGKLINSTSEDAGLVVKGFYSYTGNNGENHEVHYTADKQGFHPQLNATYSGITQPQNKPTITITTELFRLSTKPPIHLFGSVAIVPIGSAAVGSLAGGGIGKK